MSKKNDIRLLRINYLRGPNMWTYRPVLEVWLDLGELEDHPSHLLPGFNDRLTAALPNLIEHHCGVGERGGFLERLREGTWCGHVLEHIVIELLNLAGMPTGFGQTRSTSQRGVYRMVFRARDEQVARAALAEGHALIMATINDEPFDVAAAVARVRDKLDDCYLGPSTAAIVAAATDRRIPHIRLNDGNLVQLGHGARQRRIWTAETDMTSAIAEGIAGDKDLTKTLLKAVGVPVPEGQEVKTVAEAWEAAQDIGLPVVIKPSDGNHGRGVTLDIANQADCEAAFKLADAEGSSVLVESYIRGNEHRVLVVGGRVVAAARGEAAWVHGDGQHSIAELVDLQINTDPRRGLTEDFPLNRIVLGEDAVVLLDLQRQGFSPEAVPPAGKSVLIQRNGNVAIDCTAEVHPEVAHAVSLAARTVGLDIAGVDLVTEDISKPLAETGGAIVEVNAGPGLLMHLKPAGGAPQPVGQAIIDHLFAEDENGRIPIVGVAGSRGGHQVTRLVAWLLHLNGRHVGLACRDGLFLGTRRVEKRNSARWDAAHRLLMNRGVNAVVVENDPASILRDGLAYDRCHVGVVTDLDGAEALAEFDVQEADQLYKVLRTQVDVVLSDGAAVLNAACPRLVDMAELSDGEVVFYAEDGELEALRHHRERGGRAVFLRGGAAVLAQGPAETPGANIEALLRRFGERATDASTLLAAVATAWALGISPELIAAGLDTFVPELHLA
ncbi:MULTISPECIES: cyanophycin synthetase [Roseateles]|uniref:Cyanophycin synthetase n=1 Tax=Pelomonas caseinilytica TaxID=2906763 RepID=A0ABS8XLJ7_9BURK|nr:MULTISPECIES: cyanophycin synthetase [unclassified Roseateles]MCE4539474.1 cyanophycin synthetase [Pelomonas sp. P7]HEV6964704.1 cyanophycin synthetase [Roseateles sp.]